MAVDTSLLTDYTFAQIKLAAKHAMVSAAVGGAELRMPDGRNIGRISPEQARSLYEWADEMAQIEDNLGGMNALANFGEPQSR
jgi:hypothetical protein